jgi:FtsH-binding integral membrane protein
MAKEAVMGAVVNVGTQERVAFIRRTYAHLMGAIVAFIVLEFFLLRADFARPLVLKMISGYNWAGVLVAFMAVGWIADWWAQKTESKALQYLGLGIYVVAEAFIFLPIIYIANRIDPQIVPTAGIITLLAFAGLTLTVFVTGKDFSFLRGFLFLLTFVGIGILVAGLAFGFPLGMWFSALFVAIASGYVLYYTSNILYHYRTDQHVSAALGLFAAIALLFWYILRIGIALASSD